MTHQRPNWDEYFIEVVHALAKRATCDRGRTACVLTKDNRILASGYVGAPPGMPHCDDVGHDLRTVVLPDGTKSVHCMRGVHAEQNAICQAARFGIPLEGATLYCKMSPCRTCAMLLVSCGIKEIVAEFKYQTASESEEILKSAGISIRYIHDEEIDYGKKES